MTDDDEPDTPPAPLLELRDGLPPVVEDGDVLAQRAADLAAASGAVAIDAERASGYRYSARAYLIQLRREGAGTMLVDPIAVRDLSPLVAALEGTEWILHAATQDLPCLLDVGLRPTSLFDTELAGRLLGYPRVGLATLVQEITGLRLRKEHSAVDWSRRPLPQPWLEYAALDVEVLIELRDALQQQLVNAGKWEWARQEFEHLLAFTEPTPRAEPWRRLSGLHRVRGRRPLAAARELWQTRDRIARERDVTPSKLLPDSALVAAASAMPTTPSALLKLQGFHGRAAKSNLTDWFAALEAVRQLPDADLPLTARRQDGPPPPRAWADKDPAAAARLSSAREALKQLADELSLPVENLVTPDCVRRLLWQPPDSAAVASTLSQMGARPWQVELTAPLLAEAIEQPPRLEEG
jgi:ribonuclease D